MVDMVKTFYDGRTIHTRSDLWNPREYREWLVCGPLRVQRWNGSPVPGNDRTPAKLDRLLPGTAAEWSVYTADTSHPQSVMDQMLLVFRYLSGMGSHICLYDQSELEILGPETPVARIDISDKPEGSTILRRFANDVLYVFYTSGVGTPHDTRVLERTDPYDRRFGSFHAPEDGLTLSGLRAVLGNCCPVVTVYGYLDVTTAADRLRFKDYSEAHPRYARPLGIVARNRESAEALTTAGYNVPIETGRSAFDGFPVRLYRLYHPMVGNSSEACIRDIGSILDMMCAVAILDLGDRRRPVPELGFEYQHLSDEGETVHHLHTRISPDAVYGELYAYANNLDDLFIHVYLTVSSATGAVTGLKADIDSTRAYHEWDSADCSGDPMSVWCMDRMGPACDTSAWNDEKSVLDSILDDAEGVQDPSIAEVLDRIIPLIALKKVLTRASSCLTEMESGFLPFIYGQLGDYDRTATARFISDLRDEMDVDLKGCVFIPDGDGRARLRLARRFGGKGRRRKPSHHPVVGGPRPLAQTGTGPQLLVELVGMPHVQADCPAVLRGDLDHVPGISVLRPHIDESGTEPYAADVREHDGLRLYRTFDHQPVAVEDIVRAVGHVRDEQRASGQKDEQGKDHHPGRNTGQSSEYQGQAYGQDPVLQQGVQPRQIHPPAVGIGRTVHGGAPMPPGGRGCPRRGWFLIGAGIGHRSTA